MNMRQDAQHNDTLQRAYMLLNASTSAELATKFIQEDQRLLKNGEWDYQNKELILNQVKEIVEDLFKTGFTTGSTFDDDDLRDALWFWYHHATGQAIWNNKDRVKARQFSAKALEYQISENPNQITRLLYLLVRDELAEAESWLETITNEPDKSVSRGIMKEYSEGNFFAPTP